MAWEAMPGATFFIARAMLECSRFLEGYSAFRDGELGEREQAMFDAHLRSCVSCGRYHRVISRGVQLYRQAEVLTPSDDFLPRLQHRLYHVDEELRAPVRSGSGTSAVLTLGISALIAAAAWLPALRAKPSLHELPAVAARAPLPPPSEPSLLFHRGPLLVRESAPRVDWSSPPVAVPAGDLFRYSPAGAEYQLRSVAQH